jgi:hypothetical protein
VQNCVSLFAIHLIFFSYENLNCTTVTSTNWNISDGATEERRRKRRSRWGGEETKVDIGVPTAITYNMSKEQLDTYLCTLILKIKIFSYFIIYFTN